LVVLVTILAKLFLSTSIEESGYTNEWALIHDN
jgi:hypothetical protein